jgi:hypothetical protein
MGSKVLVSVVINCLNGAPYLGEAIDPCSANLFGLRDRHGIMLTDNTDEIAQSYDHNHEIQAEKHSSVLPEPGLATVRGWYVAFLTATISGNHSTGTPARRVYHDRIGQPILID